MIIIVLNLVKLLDCHFVLGMTEALVDRIHTLYSVSTTRLQLSLQDGRFLDHPLHVPHSDNCVTNERRWRISLLCAWSNQHYLGIFVTVIADLTNLRPESLYSLFLLQKIFSVFFLSKYLLTENKTLCVGFETLLKVTVLQSHTNIYRHCALLLLVKVG